MPTSERTTPTTGFPSSTTSTATDKSLDRSTPHADHDDKDSTDTGSQIRDKAQELVTHVEKLGTQATEAAGEYYQQGREQVEEWEKVLKAQLREKPIQSLAIAGGIGLILGLLLRRN